MQKLKDKWWREGVYKFIPSDIEALKKFQTDNYVNLPTDFLEYCIQINGTGGDCNNELYEFYSIDRIKRFSDTFRDWKGIPEYEMLLDSEEVQDLFVFGDYLFNLCAYAIRLSPDRLDKNEVYVFCGEHYKKITNTFSEFIDLYLNDSMELQL